MSIINALRTVLRRVHQHAVVVGVRYLLPERTTERKSAGRSVDVFSQVLGSSSENLLADDSDRLVEALVACRDRGGDRIDVVVDNAGKMAYQDCMSYSKRLRVTRLYC